MKISWSEALADYLKDETNSYASIARRYGVSKQSVVKRAVKEGWQDLRHKTLLEVDQKLTEIVGEDIALANARQAQIGKVLQYIGLKAIADKGLTPENFTQAKESIKDGVKIEREAVDAGAEERKRKEISNLFNKARVEYSFSDGDAEERLKKVEKDQKRVSLPIGDKPQEQTPSNKPLVDPKLLEQIQEQLLQIQKNTNKLQEKLEAEQAEIESSNSLSGWH